MAVADGMPMPGIPSNDGAAQGEWTFGKLRLEGGCHLPKLGKSIFDQRSFLVSD